MKVCVLTDAWTPIWGGGQEHIWQIYSRLTRDNSCQVDVLVPNIRNKNAAALAETEKYFSNRLTVRRLGPAFTFPSIIGRSLNLVCSLWWMLKHDYDIYHSHSNAAVLLPLVKTIRPKRDYVYTLHGAGVELIGGGLLNKLGLSKIIVSIWKLLLYKYPWDALLTAARSTINGKTAAKNVLVIGNGVNTAEFDKIPASHRPRPFTIIWVGRAGDSVKGLNYLKEAVAIVKRKYPEVKLNIVTNKPHTEVIREYRKSDLFVLPSLSEGLPLTLLEAMAAKLPVIVTDVGDCRMVVEEAGCGYVVAPKDSSSLSASIIRVMEQSLSEKIRMGENGYDLVKNKYTWDKLVEKQYRLYQKLLAPN